MPRRCAHCGTTDGVAADMLCDDCLHAKAQRLRADQGLPPKITDKAGLARIATILRSTSASTASRPSRLQAGSPRGVVDGAAGPTAPSRRGSRDTRTSGAAVAAPAATTRKKNSPATVGKDRRRAAPTSPAA